MKHNSMVVTSLLISFLNTAAPVGAAVLAGVNFTGSAGVSLNDADVAGFVPQKFWNNANNSSGQLSSLQGDAGGSIAAFYSGFSAQWQSAQVGSSSATALLPNSRLMKGALLGNHSSPAFVQLSGIPLFGATACVIVYADVPANTEDVEIKVTLQSGALMKTVQLRDAANQPFTGAFSRAAFPDGVIISANMVIFTGVQSSDVGVVIEPGDSNPNATVALNGIQIVPSITAFAPRIISSLKTTATAGDDFTYSLVTDSVATSRSVAGLPGGLVFDSITGVISGRPSQSGLFDVTLTAANNSGTTSETMTLAVSNSTQWSTTLFMVPAVYLEGQSGQTFKVEYANALGDRVWQFAANITLTNNSQFYVDLNATNRLSRFYRATLVP